MGARYVEPSLESMLPDVCRNAFYREIKAPADSILLKISFVPPERIQKRRYGILTMVRPVGYDSDIPNKAYVRAREPDIESSSAA